MSITTRALLRILSGVGLLLAVTAGPAARAGDDKPPTRPEETLVTPDGRKEGGRLAGEANGRFQFEPKTGVKPIVLVPGAEVRFGGGEDEAAKGSPTFHVVLGPGQRVSGRLGGIASEQVRLEDGPGHKAVIVERAGALALLQRPGEVQVLRDGFESLDERRWTQIGLPEPAADPHLSGGRSLRLPAGGSAVTHKLVEPIGAGRFEVAFHDTGAKVDRQRWFVDLTFRNAEGDLESVRAVLGWSDETLAVESPGGPALAVQRLARKPGWRRLIVRFGPERTDLAVDNDELAHGRGPGGDLVEIRLATQSVGSGDPPAGLAAYLDDLHLARLAEPSGRPEVDPSQDEIRLVTGDQLFGRVLMADPDRVHAEVDGKGYVFGWSEVSGLRFRRAGRPSAPLDGLLVRLEWTAGHEGDHRALDRVEGVLASASDADLTVNTPYAGRLTIPRDRARRLQVLGPTRRIVLDPFPHHLGNRFESDLDPPQPEGGRLELPFDLDKLPDRAGFLVVDVLQVVGETGNPDFSAEVKAGFLRTNVQLNGRPVDYLNRHISTKNDTPERIRLPIPADLLRAGANVLLFDQVGREREPEKLDNLGLLTIALEFDRSPGGEAARP